MEALKKGVIEFKVGRPMELTQTSVQKVPGLTEAQQATIQQVYQTVKAYLDTIRRLLLGQYFHLKAWVPSYLSTPERVLVITCPDGVVIRFEKKTGKGVFVVGWSSSSLAELAPAVSENIVHCYADHNYTSTIPTTGAEIKLSVQDRATQTSRELVSIRIGLDAVLKRPEHLPVHPSKPFCLLSLVNSLELIMEGVLMPTDAKTIEHGQDVVVRSRLSLPVGWECIEVYPFFDLSEWKPEYAPMWAERDLLGAVAAKQFRESHFQSLDPKAAARHEWAAVLKNFKDLLDSDPAREETLQKFLRDNPMLLCPTQIKMWPKLTLGARVTDFVFKEATGDYLLVELERSTYRLFSKNGDSSKELNHAMNQIVDWKRYLEDNLHTVQNELGLSGISTTPQGLIVIGRSKTLTSGNRRKLTSLENGSPKLKIMTYDDVYENAKSVVENLLGAIWEVPGNTEVYYVKPVTTN